MRLIFKINLIIDFCGVYLLVIIYKDNINSILLQNSIENKIISGLFNTRIFKYYFI